MLSQRMLLPILLVATLLTGCNHQPVRAAAPTLQGDPIYPGQTQNWVDTKLYFGLSNADHPGKEISEEQWRAFLDKEVTPRFPAGLSVLDVYGQWQGKDQPNVQHLRSKLLVIDYPDNAENRARIEAIRTAWKQQTGDQSVLRVTQPVEVSF